MHRVHFIGIGGIGMSALARYFLSLGCSVSGSDAANSSLLEALSDEGAAISLGHRGANVSPDCDLFIYSAAVPDANEELAAARGTGVETMTYAEALGELTRQHTTVAVSGSHGKSTTTSLVALMAIRGGLDPTVIVGTKLKEFGGKNFRKGSSKLLIIEADEYNRSFHHYRPHIAVLLNVDSEHLDTYKSKKGVVAGFARYAKQVPLNGAIVANWRDGGVRAALAKLPGERPKIVWFNKVRFRPHPLHVFGEFNQVNAEAAWQAAKLLGVRRADAERAEVAFRGTWRRQEQLAARHPELGRVISDYAHHPTEIKATLYAIKERYPSQPLTVVFQPHQQDRLTRLFKEFLTSFKHVDGVVILPAYAVEGRDANPGDATDAFALAQQVGMRQANVSYAPEFADAVKTVEKLHGARGVTVFMGAGDIDANLRAFLKV